MMRSQIEAVYRDTRMTRLSLMAALIAVFSFCAWLVGGVETVLILAMASALAYYLTPRVNPRYLMLLHRARPIAPNDPLYRVVQALAARARLTRVPELYLAPARAPNAFAVGDRDHAAIALSVGCLHLLNRRELTGVLAHEIAHIANGDTKRSILIELFRRMTGIAAFAGSLLLLGYWWQFPGIAMPLWMPIAFLIGPALAFVLQRGLSRTSEHLADADATALTGDPHGLASALVKISRAARPWWARFAGLRTEEVPQFLQTHPQTEERVRRLLAIEPQPDGRTIRSRQPNTRRLKRRLVNKPIVTL